MRRVGADQAVTPPIWPHEVADALLAAQRRARIGDNDPNRVRRASAALRIEVETGASDHLFSTVSELLRK